MKLPCCMQTNDMPTAGSHKMRIHVPTSSSLVLGRKSLILGGLAAATNSSSLSSRPEEMMWTSPLKMLR
jgi:hypothetical protein